MLEPKEQKLYDLVLEFNMRTSDLIITKSKKGMRTSAGQPFGADPVMGHP